MRLLKYREMPSLSVVVPFGGLLSRICIVAPAKGEFVCLSTTCPLIVCLISSSWPVNGAGQVKVAEIKRNMIFVVQLMQTLITISGNF